MSAAPFCLSVPVGAYHDLLPACLASLACQRDLCSVSLLDASGDPRVRALADRYGSLFAYRRHGPDEGQAAAIVEGWRNAPGEILGWLNADDFLYPETLARVQKSFAGRPDLTVATGHSAICDAAGRMTGYHWAVQQGAEALRLGGSISQPSCFFKREACEAVGGLDPTLHYTMDWDLWLRLLEDGAKFEFIDAPLSVVYWGEGTKTTSYGRVRRLELERLIARHTPAAKRFKVRRGFALRAALDLLPSQQIARFVEGRLRRRTPFVYGVGPNGALASRAEIFWMHYDAAPRRSLKIALDKIEGVNCAGPGVADVERGAGELRVEFATPVAAATTVSVTLEHSGGARLISCAWS